MTQFDQSLQFADCRPVDATGVEVLLGFVVTVGQRRVEECFCVDGQSTGRYERFPTGAGGQAERGHRVRGGRRGRRSKGVLCPVWDCLDDFVGKLRFRTDRSGASQLSAPSRRLLARLGLGLLAHRRPHAGGLFVRSPAAAGQPGEPCRGLQGVGQPTVVHGPYTTAAAGFCAGLRSAAHGRLDPRGVRSVFDDDRRGRHRRRVDSRPARRRPNRTRRGGAWAASAGGWLGRLSARLDAAVSRYVWGADRVRAPRR